MTKEEFSLPLEKAYAIYQASPYGENKG